MLAIITGRFIENRTLCRICLSWKTWVNICITHIVLFSLYCEKQCRQSVPFAKNRPVLKFIQGGF